MKKQRDWVFEADVLRQATLRNFGMAQTVEDVEVLPLVQAVRS